MILPALANMRRNYATRLLLVTRQLVQGSRLQRLKFHYRCPIYRYVTT
jgi:hypothetical protein